MLCGSVIEFGKYLRFERSKGGGLLSWLTSSDRTEVVDGYDCKVGY